MSFDTVNGAAERPSDRALGFAVELVENQHDTLRVRELRQGHFEGLFELEIGSRAIGCSHVLKVYVQSGVCFSQRSKAHRTAKTVDTEISRGRHQETFDRAILAAKAAFLDCLHEPEQRFLQYVLGFFRIPQKLVTEPQDIVRVPGDDIVETGWVAVLQTLDEIRVPAPHVRRLL